MITEGVAVRDARTDELDAVARLLTAAYREYRPGPDTPEDLRGEFAAYENDIVDVRARLADSVLIVAEQGGRLAGSVTYYPPRPTGTGENWPPGWAGIRLLGVSPEARGRGIGRALTEECVARARGVGASTIGLHTTSLMVTARGMYERMGFRRVPEHDFLVTDDFIVMAYRLDLV
ncbi:MAG: GNAT family N-acetyltransferase [Actinomycetota bacterium]